MNFIGTFWSLLPPLIAIGLALITKEVYSSLFIGILAGGLLYAGFSFTGTLEHVLVDGFIGSIADSWNVGILVFLVVLGAMVVLMNKAGGSTAFGRWAFSKMKGKKQAQLSTIGLGCLIFVDDYFNCLTVGSVMRPVTDKFKINRAKLAYLIDSTAAPVCIIAPISSWAAAVTGMVEGANGFTLFIRAIPYNFYALLTIAMMLAITLLNVDFGPMARQKDEDVVQEEIINEEPKKGKVLDLVLPVVVLIICCVIGMIYTGGFFDGVNFIDAFAGCDASVGLTYGSTFSLVFTIAYYVLSKTMSFKECMECLPEGFKTMVPSILILTFAWTLNGMTSSLGAKDFVAGIVQGFADNHVLMSLIPAVVFLIACVLSFATGTSWGTFGILIPILVPIFGADLSNELMIVSISACMAGAVCGDHCSPISDTTIMASAGAGCDHVKHVSTQLPYALFVACISFVTYIVAGFIRNWLIALPIGIGLLLVALVVIKRVIQR